MAKLVTKFKYLKPNRKVSAGGYAKYIATREGVEKAGLKNCMTFGMSKRKIQSAPTQMKFLTGFRLSRTRNSSQSRMQ